MNYDGRIQSTTIGATKVSVATRVDLVNYTMALASDIPSMTPYALLASPNFTGTTLSSQPLLARSTTPSPAYYNAGRRIEWNVVQLIQQLWILFFRFKHYCRFR